MTAQTDTLGHVDQLRAAVRAHPDSFPLVLALGRALARAASEREKDWQPRAEARKYLDRAFQLRPSDPRPLLEIGLLLRKAQMRDDALRVLRRATARADDAVVGLSPADRAEIHYQVALVHETRWEDGEYLGLVAPEFITATCPEILRAIPATSPVPSRPSLIVSNIVCPNVYDEMMTNWEPLNLYEDDYAAMIGHFREVLRADSTHLPAATRLLRHFAAARDWVQYFEVAQPLARRLPDDPTALLLLGLGYSQTGRPGPADSAFSLALDHASHALLGDWLEPSQLLRRQDSVAFASLAEPRRAALGDIYWRARDPYFLTAGNERLAEHLARLAWVELAYSSPTSGVRGRWTDRGAAWLRYGRPLRIRAVDLGDGALEFWDYGEGDPDLVFRRTRGYRYARTDELTAEYLRIARDAAPELSPPGHPRMVARVPFQAVTFRASDGGSVLEVYGALPVGTLRDSSDLATVETGLFVVTGDHWEPRASLRGTSPTTGPDTVPLDATFPLAAGNYVVSLEAFAAGVGAQTRQRVDVPAFGPGLALSDPLLVERLDAPLPVVDDRAGLQAVVSRTRLFPAGRPVGVVWEIYGLRTDSTGAARYTVTVEVSDTSYANEVIETPDGVAADRAPQGTRLQWEVSRVPRVDGAVVEYVMMQLPNARPDSYRVFITVTDRASGQSVTVHRPFAITGH